MPLTVLAACSGCVSTSSRVVETGRERSFHIAAPERMRTVVLLSPEHPGEVTVVREARCGVRAVERTHREERMEQGPSWLSWTVAVGAGVGGLAVAEEDPGAAALLLGLGSLTLVMAYQLSEDWTVEVADEVVGDRLDPIVCRSRRVAGLRVVAGEGGQASTDARGVARFAGAVDLRRLRVNGRRVDEVRVVGGAPVMPGAGR